MKKWLIGVMLGSLCMAGNAAALPDNMYFKAMQAEMQRSLKGLHRPGVAKLFYIAYKLENIQTGPTVRGSLGALYPSTRRDDSLTAYVWVDIGTPKQDSLGYQHDAYYAQHAYRPRRETEVSKSYQGLRHSLWFLTDQAYAFASETYQQKQAYRRKKQTDTKVSVPDFMPQKQGSYNGEIRPLPAYTQAGQNELKQWVQELSCKGQEYPFLEQFLVEITPLQREEYYLNSLGGYYQWALPAVRVEWTARFRNQDGFKQQRQQTLWLPDLTAASKELVNTYNTDFLQQLQQLYHAKKGKAYVGPVLLAPAAAAKFMGQLFVENMQHLSPVLSAAGPDPQAGLFGNKENMWVISQVVDVQDKPLWNNYRGTPLWGFAPVDDEGVQAQELTLSFQGRVADFPRSSRPFNNQQVPSNGHARMTYTSLPRERLTNILVRPKEPLGKTELEAQFMQTCQSLDLEYCYILYDLPDNLSEKQEVPWALQVNTKDGTRQFVYGLELDGLTPRALRDIKAAGNDFTAIPLTPDAFSPQLPQQSIVTPSLLVEEWEMVPNQKQPDKAPFVPRPQ